MSGRECGQSNTEPPPKKSRSPLEPHGSVRCVMLASCLLGDAPRLMQHLLFRAVYE